MHGCWEVVTSLVGFVLFPYLSSLSHAWIDEDGGTMVVCGGLGLI